MCAFGGVAEPVRTAGCAAWRMDVGEMWLISFLCELVHTLGLRVMGVGPGGSFCPRGGAGGRVFVRYEYESVLVARVRIVPYIWCLSL